jgi:CheY-like chemotaxis protein
VIPLQDGGDVLTELMSTAIRSDLIIADWRLPGNENGIDVVKRIRTAAGRQIPAVIITGDTSTERADEAKIDGCHILYKPTAPDELTETIDRLIGSRDR